MCCIRYRIVLFLKNTIIKAILLMWSILHFLKEQNLKKYLQELWLMFKLDSHALFSLPFVKIKQYQLIILKSSFFLYPAIYSYN